MKLKLRWGDYQRRLMKLPYKLRGIRDQFLPKRIVDFSMYYDEQEIVKRVEYYNKMNATFEVQNPTPIWQNKFMKNGKLAQLLWYYKVDLFHFLAGMKNARRGTKVRIDYLFRYVIIIPPTPTIVKSRPIAGDNRNSILLKLNIMRHYRFARDPLSWEQKQDRMVWRGAPKVNPRRVQFIEKFRNHPKCNVAGIMKKRTSLLHVRNDGVFLDISEHLKYKFIVSIEGVDVATNLQWIMSSNSLCLAPQMKYETWFMEGTLIKDFHYVQLADDFSDLLEKMDYYLAHPNEAKEIIANANQRVAQFQDQKREDYIGRRVLMKYLQQSGQ